MAKLHYHHEPPLFRKVPCTSDHQNYPGGYKWRDCKCRNMVDCVVELCKQNKVSVNVALLILQAVLLDHKDDSYASYWLNYLTGVLVSSGTIETPTE